MDISPSYVGLDAPEGVYKPHVLLLDDDVKIRLGVHMEIQGGNANTMLSRSMIEFLPSSINTSQTR